MIRQCDTSAQQFQPLVSYCLHEDIALGYLSPQSGMQHQGLLNHHDHYYDHYFDHYCEVPQALTASSLLRFHRW